MFFIRLKSGFAAAGAALSGSETSDNPQYPRSLPPRQPPSYAASMGQQSYNSPYSPYVSDTLHHLMSTVLKI